MFLVLSTGSNLDDSISLLSLAKLQLQNHFELLEESRIFKSEPILLSDQPHFLNQILVFKWDQQLSPEELLKLTQKIEAQIGRNKTIEKGPRRIDIDICFLGNTTYQSQTLSIPHHGALSRSFVVKPLKELDCFHWLSQFFEFSDKNLSHAEPI